MPSPQILNPIRLISVCSVGSTSTIKNFPGSARAYLAIDPDFSIVAASRDPCFYEFQGPLRQATDNNVSVSSHEGAVTVTPEQYVSTALALESDLVIALSDEIPNDAKRTRALAAVKRTTNWLTRCLDIIRASSKPSAVFGCVQGAQYLDYRETCAMGVKAAMPSLAGICVGGLGTGESPQQRAEIIELVLKDVPADKARMISSVGTPEEVLAAVSQGIDIFDLSYIADLTAGGYALNFPTNPEEEDADSSGAEFDADSAAVAGCDDTKMNLWGAVYRTDARALVPGCKCLACASHTRAYIHHLLQSHEMTAQVLLEAHNTAHYLKFFGAVRKAIAEGRFQEYRDWMMRRKQKWLMGIGAV